MDGENYIYLKNKVERYDKFELLKENLVEIQELLVKDHDIEIRVDDEGVNRISLNEKLPFGMKIDEHEELMREIKDNLIDTIGMKIIEIEYKMKEL